MPSLLFSLLITISYCLQGVFAAAEGDLPFAQPLKVSTDGVLELSRCATPPRLPAASSEPATIRVPTPEGICDERLRPMPKHLTEAIVFDLAPSFDAVAPAVPVVTPMRHSKSAVELQRLEREEKVVSIIKHLEEGKFSEAEAELKAFEATTDFIFRTRVVERIRALIIADDAVNYDLLVALLDFKSPYFLKYLQLIGSGEDVLVHMILKIALNGGAEPDYDRLNVFIKNLVECYVDEKVADAVRANRDSLYHPDIRPHAANALHYASMLISEYDAFSRQCYWGVVTKRLLCLSKLSYDKRLKIISILLEHLLNAVKNDPLFGPIVVFKYQLERLLDYSFFLKKSTALNDSERAVYNDFCRIVGSSLSFRTTSSASRDSIMLSLT